MGESGDKFGDKFGDLAAAARELQATHRVEPPPARPLPVWAAIDSVPGWLRRARAFSADPEPEAAKAAEWLLDNAFWVERTVTQVRKDLPVPFYVRLPRLADPIRKGIPRIYALANALLQVSRLQLSLPGAIEFVRAYQEDTPLTIAELWAFPTMLRLACIEILVVSFGRLAPSVEPPFEVAAEPRISTLPEDTECVARALANLRVIATTSWNDFFDSVSCVEAALRDDPADIYRRMDFETRDRYRKAIEELALGARLEETQAAERVLRHAREADASPHNHVGYWLLGDGRMEFEAACGFRPSTRVAIRGWLMRHAGSLYTTALVAAGIAALLVPAAYLIMEGNRPGVIAVGVALSVLPASILSVTIVNWLVTLAVAPRILPKLSLDDGIPPECATIVVMPAILASRSEVARIVERLEMHRLANPDPSLRFVLLTDYADADTEHVPGDEETTAALSEGIRRLNDRYGAGGKGPFHLLHRPRQFNPSEGRWIGWERKRGKLEQFNRLVLGEEPSAFAIREGDAEALRGQRFVVTVDADTMLPPGSVAKLVGILAHPMNKAAIDPKTGRVTSGYTIIQPRVEISPESGNRSIFARLYAGDTSIDIYSRAVSNVYHDLFGSGVYVGKGIYEIESFHRGLADRVPENAIVSHDLFEGAHGRAGLATDIVLYEDFPASYAAYARRWRRWVRGDWQLLPWLARLVPSPVGRIPNTFGALDRWRIFDNLRRSLMPPALIALALAGWLVLPGSPWVWSALAIATPGAHVFTDLVTGLAHGRRRGAVRGVFRRTWNHSGRWFLAVSFLLNDAILAVNAVVRTIWRLTVSRRYLLQWTSAAHDRLSSSAAGLLADTLRLAWPTPLLSLSFAAAVAALAPHSLLAAAPLLLLWFLSPLIAVLVSRPYREADKELTEDERGFLRLLARRTWLYFETFVGPEDNWLPPDNVHDTGHPEVAHRTSPTNVGMYLLASLTAWQLGHIGTADFAARMRGTLSALHRIERYRGHMLNWYDTRSLSPLEPRYVSTVDSGNLAVSLIALKEGCRDAAAAPALRAERWDGLVDALQLLQLALDQAEDETAAALSAKVEPLIAQARHLRTHPTHWREGLARLCKSDIRDLEEAIGKAIAEPAAISGETLRAMRTWLERADHHLRTMLRDITDLAPWDNVLEEAPALCQPLAQSIAKILDTPVTLTASTSAFAHARRELNDARTIFQADQESGKWLTQLDAAIEQSARALENRGQALLDIAEAAETMAYEMDFGLLFDRQARHFHIGYNLSSNRIDFHHYDLLASEARLASYFAIAKGDVPVEHWFFLGRPITRAAGNTVLLSWNGSMFEYLMPALLIRSGAGTLVGQSERAAVQVQHSHARGLGIPWGVSESAFGSIDPEHRYRYQAFGVPGLGIRRGLARDRVVAPYASALALAVTPRAAIANLRSLDALGLQGIFGFFDAADFTPDRVPAGQIFSPVRTYMAHHQGMTLAAICNALVDRRLVQLFRRDKRIRTATLLLEERVPWELPVETMHDEHDEPSPRTRAPPALYAWAPPSAASSPQMLLLGNGSLASWTTETGAGGLSWKRQAITRWLPDATIERHGLWMYIRDEDSGNIWSTGRQPSGVGVEDARVVFQAHAAEFHSRHNGIAARMDVGVVPGDDVEIRRLTVVNESDRARRISLTSYAEVVLAPPQEDERHPAFSKLFVGSDHIAALDGLLFTRRPRRPEDRPPVLLHRILWDDRKKGEVAFDTDRRSFIGRGGTLRHPHALAGPLAGTVGWTLDPIMALQARTMLEPQERREIAFLTMVSGSRESVIEVAERYSTLASLEWALQDAATDVAREAQRLGLDPALVPQINALASIVHSAHHARRAVPLSQSQGVGQPRLWGLGLSGDLPIILLYLNRLEVNPTLLADVVAAHRFLRRRNFEIDLVILRTGASGYEEPVRERVLRLLDPAGGHDQLGRRGGIHLLFSDQIGTEQVRLLELAARFVFDDTRGSLGRQLELPGDELLSPPPFRPGAVAVAQNEKEQLLRPDDLSFDNGIGGFSSDGREYVINLSDGQQTPAPWCNVLANENFGSIATEAGFAFTWAINSGENRLTPWPNDPVMHGLSEALYLRDEETGEIWTPTPAPAGGGSAFEIRHGAGYTCWRQRRKGLETSLTAFIAINDPVKVARLRIHNSHDRARRITATYYADWLLGALPSVSKPHVASWYDAECHALLARNAWNADFADRTAFLTATLPPHSLTTDRLDFLGRNGDPSRPAGLTRWDLGGHTTPRADACAALQVHLDVGPGETVEFSFVLGQDSDAARARVLANKWRNPDSIATAWTELARHWDRRLGAVTVHTPDSGFDLAVNRWLTYQTLVSRIMARAGFYQAGGAIGFRDQLQDVLALLHSDPSRARAHILACAAHQFEEGDVLHWWHPPADRGVRTRCSDDLLWLPFATAGYVEATGDLGILDEEIPFLRAPPLNPNEDDRYDRFEAGPERRPLVEHCQRALERGVTKGPNGLPLIGSGDWNDGMDQLGRRGRGQSVWLAWFAVATMDGFARLARRIDRNDLANHWTSRSEELRRAIEAIAWDGNWYLRAIDDDGRAIGSAASQECRIDSIAQSWAVLAGGVTSHRARSAVDTAFRELASGGGEDRIFRLFWPPFHDTPLDPGYIKAYPPGIRENGGQYTHAAAWLGLALAELEDGDRALEVFHALSPVRRTSTAAGAAHYRVEPYVIAADIAGAAPHAGRGGWTWYTGSAAWTWRLAVEGILGIRLRDGDITLDPCLPRAWGGFEAEIRCPDGKLAIKVVDADRVGSGIAELWIDGKKISGASVPCPKDGTTRNVVVRLGRSSAQSAGR